MLLNSFWAMFKGRNIDHGLLSKQEKNSRESAFLGFPFAHICQILRKPDQGCHKTIFAVLNLRSPRTLTLRT